MTLGASPDTLPPAAARKARRNDDAWAAVGADVDNGLAGIASQEAHDARHQRSLSAIDQEEWLPTAPAGWKQKADGRREARDERRERRQAMSQGSAVAAVP
jgi:hypothetical protein